MNYIDGVIVVGSPRSQARYNNAPSVCENCLLTEFGECMEVNSLSSKIETCYVCESITLIFKVVR